MAAQLQKRPELFDFSTFSGQDVDRYGTPDLGRHMLHGAAACSRRASPSSRSPATAGTRTATTSTAHLSLVPKFDQAFAALIEDLAERGMLDNVLVIAMSEFGRTPRINGHLGRDHWPRGLVAGHGRLRAEARRRRRQDQRQGHLRSPASEHDIGHLFHTWFRALGIDPDKTKYDNDGQPLPHRSRGLPSP